MAAGNGLVPVGSDRYAAHDDADDEGDGAGGREAHHHIDEFAEPRVGEYTQVEEENRHPDREHGRAIDDAFRENQLCERVRMDRTFSGYWKSFFISLPCITWGFDRV